MSDNDTRVVGKIVNIDDEMLFIDNVFPNEQVRDQMVQYLINEYNEITEGDERMELGEDWEEWRRISVAKPKSRTKDEPWPGAANVVTPFTFSNINGVFSHLKSAVAEKHPRWQCIAGDEEASELAASCQRWLNELMLSKLHINITEKDEELLWDIARMGTQFAEVPWTTNRVQFKRKTRDGSVQVIDKTTYDGPTIVRHRLEDVIVRSHWKVQTAPCIGFAHEFTKQDLLREEHNGFFEDVERVFSSPAEKERSRAAEGELIGVSSSNYEQLTDIGTPYRIVKFYVAWDADEDGMPEDLIVWIEPTSKAVLRAEFNELGVRPIGVGKYIGIPDMIYAIGVCSMLYRLQEEIDSMHNIGINSLHVSSLQMFATPRGAGVGPNEKFFPLKNIQLDDPQRDINVITFPNVSGATLEREHVAQQYGRTVTGISEGQLGMPDTTAKSGTSPTLQQFMAQQGNKVLRSVIASVADFYGELGQYVMLQLVANSDRVLAGNAPLLKLASPDDVENIKQVLNMDVEDIPQMFQFSVKTTEADKTDDAKRQMLMMKHQLMAQYMQQAMEVVQMLDNPQVQQMPTVKEFVTQMYVALTKLMEESLGLFDVDKPSDYLPNYEMQEIMLQINDFMKSEQVMKIRSQFEGVKNGRQGISEPPGGTGVYQPGYTEGENVAGDAGGPGVSKVVGGPAPSRRGGPTTQPPGPGVAGPG